MVSTRLRDSFLTLAIFFSSVVFSHPAFALFLDGNGHYSLRGETRTSPGMSSGRGTHRAIDQNFRLEGEARFNDQSSFFLEFRLFDDPDEAFVGDKPKPNTCFKNSKADNTAETGEQGSDHEDCQGEYQNTSDPGYEPLTLKATKAYARYAFDYCILEAGRRGRNWGMGLFLDSGDDPFDTSQSIYDGVTCNINIQKSQSLGFSVGYDKLSETGTYPFPNDDPNDTTNFGAANINDDLDQYFFTIEFDDRKTNAGSGFTKQIGIYFANITGADFDKGGSSTDVKFLDLYTAFYFSDFAIKNELIFRNGRSGDPNFVLYGGAIDEDENPVRNKVDSVGLAGVVEWTLSRSGASIGPIEYNKGNASRHLIAFDYLYAPGDRNGYYTDLANDNPQADVPEINSDKKKANAIAFHKNFKPALIFFNGRAAEKVLRVNGVFDPQRVMNTTLIGLSYRFESTDTINVETKLITGQLNETIPADVKQYYLDQNSEDNKSEKPIGFFGRELGYELDIKLWNSIMKDVDYGFAAAYALPGNAWKTREGQDPAGNFLIQSYVSFNF